MRGIVRLGVTFWLALLWFLSGLLGWIRENDTEISGD